MQPTGLEPITCSLEGCCSSHWAKVAFCQIVLKLTNEIKAFNNILNHLSLDTYQKPIKILLMLLINYLVVIYYEQLLD